MAWRAAATVLSSALLLLSLVRQLSSVRRDPMRVLAAGMLACILGIAMFGAFNVSLAVVVAASELVTSAA